VFGTTQGEHESECTGVQLAHSRSPGVPADTVRLLTFIGPEGELRLGALQPGGVVDLPSAANALGLPSAVVDPTRIITLGEDGISIVRDVLDRVVGRPNLVHDEASLVLGPAVPRPGKIIGVGLNYARHVAEAAMDLPEYPVLFAKYSNALAGHATTITLPHDAAQYDYEVELAVIIGRRAKRVPVERARGYVLGYATANDLSARDLQFRTSQWLLGKSLDGFLPLGPYLVTSDEVVDPGNLELRSWVNGELRQDGCTCDMIFDIDQLIGTVSRYISLDPGDIIITGTPDGAVLGRPNPVWLRGGDLVEVEVEGLGRLSNRLALEVAHAPH
jgi:2-keto-4-pentenoate hydratase/2-oxohepta-3-ene-1,7-dioic acid hydratase in catechol pathway